MRLRWCLVNDDDVGDGDVENSSLNSQTKRKRKVSLHVKSGDDNGEQASDSKRTFVDFLGMGEKLPKLVFLVSTVRLHIMNIVIESRERKV